jgi:RNA polymerase sigma-70 factor (ECF subfamily)
MFHVALGMLRNRADAEEIVQDTFIRAHRALAKFRGDSSLATWLNRITINLARNRYWYFFRRRRHTTSSIDRAFSENSNATFADLLAADAAGPAREAVSNEFSNLVSACMERLGAQPREILALRVSQNRTYDEIALALGINVGTVKSRIGRARKGLRALLAEACPEFGTAAEPSDWFESFRPAGEVRIVSA